MIHIAEDRGIRLQTSYQNTSTLFAVKSTAIRTNERPLLDSMGSSQEPPLDEIQWRSPQIAQSMTGIQTNTGSDSLCLQSLF